MACLASCMHGDDERKDKALCISSDIFGVVGSATPLYERMPMQAQCLDNEARTMTKHMIRNI